MKIECLGDSITEGWITDFYGLGWKGHVTYPKTLASELCGAEVKNLGISGSLIREDSYKRLSGNADIVILLYGLNNYMTGKNPLEYLRSNAREIMKMSKLFMVNYPLHPDGEYAYWVERTNMCISEIAEEMKVPLLDAKSHFDSLMHERPQEKFFGSDLVHLSESGYIELGKFIAENI